MTRDGVVLENQATGEEINISDREAEQDFTPSEATGRVEKVLERADRTQDRRSMKKAAKQTGQVEGAASLRPSARLQFSEEEHSTPELKKYIRKSDRRADRLDAARAAIPKETVKIEEKVFDEASSRARTRVCREKRDKPPPAMTIPSLHKRPAIPFLGSGRSGRSCQPRQLMSLVLPHHVHQCGDLPQFAALNGTLFGHCQQRPPEQDKGKHRPRSFMSFRMASNGPWGIAWVQRKADTASLIIWKFNSVPSLSGT